MAMSCNSDCSSASTCSTRTDHENAKRHNEPDAIQYGHLVLALRMLQATLERLESCPTHQLHNMSIAIHII